MRKMIFLAAFVLLSCINLPLYASTLSDVKAKGYIKCGVSQGLPGFSSPDDSGKWAGLDVDLCRGVAAAVFGNADKVEYSPLSEKMRLDAVRSGEVDILSRNTTWTQTRDTALGINFVGVDFYDGQGFLVPKSLGVKSALELSGAAVCLQTGTTTELNVTDYFDEQGMDFKLVAFESENESRAAYDDGRCDVFTSDRSQLAAVRTKLSDPSAHIVLPETISKEPLSPVVREGDAQWEDIVRWVLFAMINAEELGVTSENIDSMKGSKNASIQRLIGGTGDMGKNLGLGNDWAYNVIKRVGNYGEVYERNVGPNTPLGLPRGINEQWSKGGILYAPPLR